MPRTATEIGREIGGHQACADSHLRRVAELKAELADAQSSVIEVQNVIGTGSVTFERSPAGSLDVVARFHASDGRGPQIIREGNIDKLRDFLNYHWPVKETT